MFVCLFIQLEPGYSFLNYSVKDRDFIFPLHTFSVNKCMKASELVTLTFTIFIQR